MSRIRGHDTQPELAVREVLRSLGYRYRLHLSTIPGRPDITIRKHNAVIFVHGCFWHMHKCRYGAVVPKTNGAFWAAKRQANVNRDKRVRRELRSEWKILTVWECETKNLEKLAKKLTSFLDKH